MSTIDDEFDLQTKAVLAGTWFFSPAEPLQVGGYLLACPGCGRSDDIQYWLHYGMDVVRGKHVCVPFERPGAGRVRDWDEHRISPEFLREHGRTARI